MTEYKTFSFEKGDFVDGDDNGFKPGYMKVGSENKKKEADSFKSRFASNMADYFKDNPDAFKFKEGSVGDRSAKFADQFGGSFDEVAEGFGIFNLNKLTTIRNSGTAGLLQQ